VHVFALGQSEYVILLHHIVGDGWSLAPLLRDLSMRARAGWRIICARSASGPSRESSHQARHGGDDA
jgi:hypothetical protein